MSGRHRDEAEPTVGVFWDYENIRFPSGLAPHSALATLRDLALSKGSVDSLRAYMDLKFEQNSVRLEDLRARMAQAGWTLANVPHDGRKDVVDKMIMFDMVMFAMKAKSPPVIILITGDQDYFYACNQLRLNRCKIILITTPNAAISLRQAAHEVLDWRLDILKLRQDSSQPAGRKKRFEYAASYEQRLPPQQPQQAYTKPVHPALASHSIALQQPSQGRRMLPAFVTSRFDKPSPPPAYSSLDASTSSSTLLRQPAPLPPMALTEERGGSRTRAWDGSSEPDRSLLQLRADALLSSTERRRKGKGRAVEVLTLSDDDEDEGEEHEDSDLEIFAPSSAKTPSSRPRHSRGNSDPLSSVSRPRSSPRRAMYGNPVADLDAPHPPSTMDESAYGSSSPRGKIEVMYSLHRSGKPSSSSSSSTPAGTSKKRLRAVDLLQLSDPPLPSPSHSPGGHRRKRPRAASEPVEDSDDEHERGAAAKEENDADLSLDPDTSEEIALNPATPFSARSTASSHYDLLLTHPSPSDGEQSPLFIHAGGKRRTGTPLARKVAAKAVAGRSRLAEEVKDDEESESDDDSVVILSD